MPPGRRPSIAWPVFDRIAGLPRLVQTRIGEQQWRPGGAPGFQLHPLKGDRAGPWSVRVSGNWLVLFRSEYGEVVDMDLIDFR